MTQTKNPSDRQVFITREIAAPVEIVFRAWTDPEQLVQWHAPNGCTFRFRTVDLRQGGTFHSCIHTPDGQDCWVCGQYVEIVPNQKLVYTMAMADENGNRVDSVSAGKESDWPAETTVTVTFEPKNGKTLLTLSQTVSEAVAKRTGAYPSWLQMFDRLAQMLAGNR
jgi:uncharacterized protein YndB with AHSA1/START domain